MPSGFERSQPEGAGKKAMSFSKSTTVIGLPSGAGLRRLQALRHLRQARREGLLTLLLTLLRRCLLRLLRACGGLLGALLQILLCLLTSLTAAGEYDDRDSDREFLCTHVCQPTRGGDRRACLREGYYYCRSLTTAVLVSVCPPTVSVT